MANGKEEEDEAEESANPNFPIYSILSLSLSLFTEIGFVPSSRVYFGQKRSEVGTKRM